MKGNDVFFLNPKYFDFFHYFDETKLSCVILKIGDSYEYISNITQKPRDKSKELLFTYDEIKALIPNVEPKLNSTLSHKLINSNVEHYVLSSTFKCTGVIIDDYFIPTGKYIDLAEKDIKKYSFVYSESIHERFKISKDVIRQYLNVSDTSIKNLKEDTSALDNLRLFSIGNDGGFEDKHEMLYNTQLYEIAKIFDKHDKFQNTIKVLNHDISNFTQKEKHFILHKILNKFKFKIHAGIDVDRILHDLLNLPTKYIINQYKYSNYELDKTEIRITYEDVLNSKLLEYHKTFNNNFKVIETSIEDNVETVEYVALDLVHNKLNDNKNAQLYLLSNERIEIKPVKIAKMFPNFEVIDKSISYADIISLSNFIDNKITIETFEKHLNEQIMKDYMQDKSELYNKYKQNINFITHKINVNDDIHNYTQLIKNSDYQYGLYELEVLSKLLKYNIVIIGRDTSFVKDGLHVINVDSNQYLFLMYTKEFNKYSFRLIIHKVTNAFIFNRNDFNERVNKLLKIFAS